MQEGEEVLDFSVESEFAEFSVGAEFKDTVLFCGGDGFAVFDESGAEAFLES